MAREFLCELSNSFRHNLESLKLDLVQRGFCLGSPRRTYIGEHPLSKTEWQCRTQNIEHMQSVRPWSNPFDLTIFLAGWNRASKLYGHS